MNYSKIYKLQRTTAFILLFVVPLYLIKLYSIKNLAYSQIISQFKDWQLFLISFLLINNGFMHCYIGFYSICTDYFSSEKTRKYILFFTIFSVLLLALISNFCLIKLFIKV